ncbi:hypothetical protein ACTWP5_22435 [Streptomyces sp. 4N509B]|uniref:hypothetical protein n=1 Tax=Streptomyces sp. 4N509B TaxID=3457413 RepID=UPI003FD09704
MFTEHQQQLRERFLAAPVTPAPAPWRPVFRPHPAIPIGGLFGVGFAPDPARTDDELLMVVSQEGLGVFHVATGVLLARDRDPDPGSTEPSGPQLTVKGIGPLAGLPIPVAGLYGGGLHSMTSDGWTIDVVSPDWPHHRVLLSTDGGLYHGPTGTHWWHIHHATLAPLRTAGFSPSGNALVVATSTSLMLLTRG